MKCSPYYILTNSIWNTAKGCTFWTNKFKTCTYLRPAFIIDIETRIYYDFVHFYTDRQTDEHFIRRILIYIVKQNGLQYNAHDSGYSNQPYKKIKETTCIKYNFATIILWAGMVQFFLFKQW